MADVTITTKLGKKHPIRKLVNELYSNGLFKTEALGLQCVGFDHELYNTLVKRFNMNNTSLKRKGCYRWDADEKAKKAKSLS